MIPLQKSNSAKENKEHNIASYMHMFLSAASQYFTVQVWITNRIMI